MPFRPGQSGNPAGRPPGVKSYVRRTFLHSDLSAEKKKALLEKIYEKAMKGNTNAMAILADRLWPRLKSVNLMSELTPHSNLEDQGREILRQMVAGKMLPEEALRCLSGLEIQAKLETIADLEERIESLTAKLSNNGNVIDVSETPITRRQLLFPKREEVINDE